MKSREFKTLVGMLQELGSAYDETANALNGVLQGARRVKPTLGIHVAEHERAGLLKLGLDVMHFPDLVPSIFLNELLCHKFVGVSLVAIGLIEEKRSPMRAVDVYENFHETVRKLREMINETS